MEEASEYGVLIPKVVRMEIEEVICKKVHVSPQPPPKISLKHDWIKELVSEDAQRPDEQDIQESKPNQTNQIQTQIMMKERGNLLFAVM